MTFKDSSDAVQLDRIAQRAKELDVLEAVDIAIAKTQDAVLIATSQAVQELLTQGKLTLDCAETLLAKLARLQAYRHEADVKVRFMPVVEERNE